MPVKSWSARYGQEYFTVDFGGRHEVTDKTGPKRDHYTVYHMQCRCGHLKWKIERRYSQFRALYEAVRQADAHRRMTGAAESESVSRKRTCKFPPKTFWKRFDDAFCDDRAKKLHAWLIDMLKDRAFVQQREVRAILELSIR